MTREVVLLVAHGARDPGNEGNREVEEMVALWRGRHPDSNIQVCWIEHAPVLLEEGIDRAVAEVVEAGGRLLVLPLILNAAGHVKEDIPQAVEAARVRHPGIEIRCARHLGTTGQLLKALRHRLHQAMVELAMPDPRTTGIVLLARGASDMESTGEVAKMAHWLYETTDHDLVLPAFTGICFPRLEQVVQRLDRLGASQIIVLPYYLFTGRLIKRIRLQVERLQSQYPTRTIYQADYIGAHDQLLDLLDLRLRQCRDGSAILPCDGCALSLAAEEEPQGAHGDQGSPAAAAA
ncbi:cobalamin (vitamin B12) biosynthesis CbiX protein [Thiorhodococcus drewsii AZ1]|uniref:Cobalamin (Vitamin B12) biosynthesis CbiX protein n=1 Tax=Thiorhodococcus drewsii AZ1 TaxID=765913 RepID=G2DZD9_9GAMM|nr:sirohydrochlorin chelatase [Thiorhodococcus drewsii]EGV32166.1 cobalamin (vitamin B12) biosynthesis CbiX protein [Thiorhodococcus drewsii AZ1]